jgi:hypothetical protein
MNVLVIPEDFRKDQFILQPVLQAMFTKLERPAIVEVLKDPLIGGISEAMKRDVLRTTSGRWSCFSCVWTGTRRRAAGMLWMAWRIISTKY